MKEVGTLEELGVKAGDVVECVNGGSVYDVVVITPSTEHKRAIYCNIGELYALSRDGNNHQSVSESSQPQWRVVSRATPKLWRDMTPEEKGALLLAAHEGRDLEYWRRGSGGWASCSSAGIYDNESYRIKPEPKVEVVIRDIWMDTLGYLYDIECSHPVRVTFDRVDGVIDVSTYKVEPR